ncbi:LCP family protein [Georgenia halophila]|uniref:LCP family protein n=1 Tax=Georgenia halophila TaxID=620889 RepID=A0ABP8LD28_9MICO
MASAHQRSDHPLGARHAKSLRRHELRRQLLTATLAIAVFLVSCLAFAYSNLQGNVNRHDVDDLLGTDRPTRMDDDGEQEGPEDARAGSALNILVLGSDSRQGANDDGSDVGGMRSDTTMIAHVSADRSRLEVVSIPRDTLVDIPECHLPNGTQTAAEYDAMFNRAFALGGQTGDVAYAAACTIQTVEELTGVPIDDFVVVDFAGFQAVIEALDGVPMYIPEPVDDPSAHVSLEAGCHVLNGQDALGYARARYGVANSDGSDINRIGRQQQLVAAIAREALSIQLLTNPPALYRFLNAGTKTLTTGEWVGRLPNMAGLANSLRGIEPENIRFATMPFEWAGARVVPAADADTVWDNLLHDRPIDADITATGDEPTIDEPSSEEPTTDAATTEEPTSVRPSQEETTPACTR